MGQNNNTNNASSSSKRQEENGKKLNSQCEQGSQISCIVLLTARTEETTFSQGDISLLRRLCPASITVLVVMICACNLYGRLLASPTSNAANLERVPPTQYLQNKHGPPSGGREGRRMIGGGDEEWERESFADKNAAELGITREECSHHDHERGKTLPPL